MCSMPLLAVGCAGHGWSQRVSATGRQHFFQVDFARPRETKLISCTYALWLHSAEHLSSPPEVWDLGRCLRSRLTLSGARLRRKSVSQPSSGHRSLAKTWTFLVSLRRRRNQFQPVPLSLRILSSNSTDTPATARNVGILMSGLHQTTWRLLRLSGPLFQRNSDSASVRLPAAFWRIRAEHCALMLCVAC